MLVDILINNYNYGRFIRDSIDSAINQNYPDIEVIVVDDGSTDNSREIIESFKEKVIPVFKQNNGQASAFNAGFSKSKGEIICFLDADDFFLPGKIKKIIETFQQYPDIGWIFHELTYVDENGIKLSTERDSAICEQELADFRETLVKGKKFRYSIPCGLCFRRNIISKILPMPEAKNVTLSDNYIKYAALSLSTGILSPAKLAVQRIHSNNTYTFREDVQQLRAEINIKTGFYLRQEFPEIALFADKFFAKGVAEMIAEFIFGKPLAIPEVKMYFLKYLSIQLILFSFPKIIYHLICLLILKKINSCFDKNVC